MRRRREIVDTDGPQFKRENPDNDTVTDAVAASAYVEQFALEVFGRAEATMRANKVTRSVSADFPPETNEHYG